MLNEDTKNIIENISELYDNIKSEFSELNKLNIDICYRDNKMDTDYVKNTKKLYGAIRFTNLIKEKLDNTSTIDDVIENLILEKRLLSKIYNADFIKDVVDSNRYDYLENIIDFINLYPKTNGIDLDNLPDVEKFQIDRLMKNHKLNNSYKDIYRKAKKSYYFLLNEKDKDYDLPFSLFTLEKTLKNNLSDYDYLLKKDDIEESDYKVYYNKSKIDNKLLINIIDLKLNFSGNVKKESFKKNGYEFLKASIYRDVDKLF